jgi:hypothetical protein
MKTGADKTVLILTAVCVGGLATAAGAISFAHMRELATLHDQLGWKSFAFPVSVDGLEIVASLYLVAQRRAGRPTGWIPWVALIVGTVASLAANIAVGGADPIGKALAGWPALSMLVSVKLLFSMFDHDGSDRTVRDDQRTAGTVHGSGRDDAVSSPTVRADRPDTALSSATGPADPAARTEQAAQTRRADGAVLAHTESPAAGTAAVDIRTVERLIPAARAARTVLIGAGRSVSRDNLADAMRADGHGVSNARASLLLKILKAEQDLPTIQPAAGPIAASGSSARTTA